MQVLFEENMLKKKFFFSLNFRSSLFQMVFDPSLGEVVNYFN